VTTATRSVFRTSAILSRLLTQEQLDEGIAGVRATPGGPPTPLVDVSDDQLAAWLVMMKKITRYQADQLMAGRTKLNLGPYIITDWIGQGGMGQVFKAEHEMMGRESAVKVLPLSKATPDAIANFAREIRTQAKLDHPNLVRAYDAGHDGNVHYLVVEFVPGTDLRKLVRTEGKLTMQQAANIIRQAALGLQYAHDQGLIHRDVKPGNILVTSKGVAKVSDLGLAGFMHEVDKDPRAGKIVGTADYLAPEQIRNPLNVTAASDIYSLGCTLYYAITGKVPYPGGSPSAKAMRHCEGTPYHPQRFNSDVHEEFVELIADMMEKDPAARVQTAAEVAARLEPWAGETGPLPSQKASPSRWMPPPLPSDVDAVVNEDAHDTGSATFDPAALGQPENPSQITQRTHPVASAAQDTRRDGSIAPPPIQMMGLYGLSRTACVAIALAIAVPMALLFGGLVGLLVGALFFRP
jgi:serine/threonine protein kinase